MKRNSALSAAIVTIFALSMFGVSGAGASEQPQPTGATKDNISSAPAETSELLWPVISEEMSRLASALTEKFQGTSNFASAEVPAERDRVIVHWNGEKTPELQKLLGEHGSVPVELRQTRFRPGRLQEQAASLARSTPAVKSYEIAHDASSISFTVTGQRDERAAAEESARGLERRTSIPVRISESAPTPANSRPFDTGYHIGGSKLYNFDNGGGCSSGFAVRQSGTNREGIMFAAHCGAVGTHWGVWDGGTTAYSWGNTTARNTTFDGAIIDSGWSQEYVWNGDYQTTGIAPIRGYAAQFVGQEICYSGGYSGTKCGNILQSANITYSLGGDLTHVNGFMTEQINGEPAAGNGDSGGPGYTFVTDSGGYAKRVAVGIISAIPQNSGTNCQGVPGSSALGGRKCSSTVYSTPVSGISNATGWYVPTYP